MTPRQTETALARFTLAILLLYFLLKMWSPLSYGLSNPFYLADIVGMALLLWGALRSLGARPNQAPGVLSTGIAWSTSTAWRDTAWRVESLRQGATIDGGAGTIWLFAAVTIIALVCLAIALLLIVESRRSQP